MSTDSKNELLTPIQFLKGGGPARAALLEKLGLRTARDLVFFFPRDYRDLTQLVLIRNLEEGTVQRLAGVIEEIDARDTGGGNMIGVLIQQGDDYLRAVWFNQPHIATQFHRGQSVLITGTPKMRGFRWEMHHPNIQMLNSLDLPVAGLLPVYRLTEGISQQQMQRLVLATVERFADQVSDVFPPALRDRCNVLPIAQALRDIHQPINEQTRDRARHRFVYQELFVMQLALGMRRQTVTSAHSPALPCDPRIATRITNLLPHALTAGQRAAVEEITADMARDRAMNRLLQGEVGSGKTMVAAFAILVAIAHRHQAVLMAPTGILANQHYETFGRLLDKSKVRIGFLTGAQSASARRTLLDAIRNGDIDLVIGTQAIAQEGVRFARLGLAVVDEGHKFGVKQRAQLRGEDSEPHYLVMTATPIPRTVSMTQFGDLDVSSLRELPPGRQPIHTYVGTEEQRARWWDFVRKKLREGRQAYVIAPLVDERSESVVSSVEQLFEQLTSNELEAFRVDLLHGRMSSESKEEAMHKFRTGETQVLVATSLVEVGVDVPNANVMTIENAERFGLAQLHQLRGRVGRGKFPGFVCVFSPADAPEARQRLAALAQTSDGFELAEIDFQLRGPGDLFGTKQHGLPPLRIADLQQDIDVLQQARADALAILAADPDLKAEGFAELRDQTLRRYGSSLDLGDVG